MWPLLDGAMALATAWSQVLRAASRTYDVPNQEAAFDTELSQALNALTGWKIDFVREARKALGFETQVTSNAGTFVLQVPTLTTGSGLRRFTDAAGALVRLGLNSDDVARWSKKRSTLKLQRKLALL